MNIAARPPMLAATASGAVHRQTTGRADLEAALAEYYSRERRFGRIPEAVAG